MKLYMEMFRICYWLNKIYIIFLNKFNYLGSKEKQSIYGCQ